VNAKTMSIQRKAEAVVAELLGESPQTGKVSDPAVAKALAQFEQWLDSQVKPGTETKRNFDVSDSADSDVIWSWANGIFEADDDWRSIAVWVTDDLKVGADWSAVAQYTPCLEDIPLMVDGRLNPDLPKHFTVEPGQDRNAMGEEWWGFPDNPKGPTINHSRSFSGTYNVNGREFTEEEFNMYVDQTTGEVFVPPGKKLENDDDEDGNPDE
jgi:hypothetical protein